MTRFYFDVALDGTKRIFAPQAHLAAIYQHLGAIPLHGDAKREIRCGEKLLARAREEEFGDDVARLINWALKYVARPGVPTIDIPHQAAYELDVPVRYIKAHLAILHSDREDTE